MEQQRIILLNKLMYILVVILIIGVWYFRRTDTLTSGIAMLLGVLIVIVFMVTNVLNRKIHVFMQENRPKGSPKEYLGFKEAIKIDKEGVYMGETSLNWLHIRKIKSKGIIQVQYKLTTHRVSPHCHYFVKIVETNGKEHDFEFIKGGYHDSNPLTQLKGKLRRAGHKDLLEELGKEWVKGEPTDPKIVAKLKNPFKVEAEVAEKPEALHPS
ncbi:MAG: hypothetical protein KKG59_03105 [Nanoarchaeota archaeon]|nr:hypothetical protein [Nanoarchaeota archaeon]